MKKKDWCKLRIPTLWIHQQNAAFCLGLASEASHKEFWIEAEDSTCTWFDIGNHLGANAANTLRKLTMIGISMEIVPAELMCKLT
jgi:hypothetical protein